ncbi:NrfD/PsrC family molybdoenzyme membrane anchor subunit [Caldilinea sp.]|uniref:NrfD/PsrC family molybdoenzyme membrane anchor subunit n=1 Tax=Caldilinea sp. TaxID=2293560 RepID=UPI002C0BDF49|nr:polysulfide reductase NrfD [Caldilinea sp.]
MAIRGASLRANASTTATELVWPAIRRFDILLGVLGFLTLAGVVAGVGRLLLGLGATTGLSDVYSWGIWIGFDFGLIAFAGAGFTMAAVVHVFHREHYHAALWPAILAGLMGYTAVLALLVLDLGRPDHFYNFILYWNVHSPLFEISCCVLFYTTVLVLETSPNFLGRLKWRWINPLLKGIRWMMLPVTIIGVTLSTLHQSTLGTLYLNMPHRLHPLWWTPFLPILFYLSSIMAGLSLATLAYRAAMRILHRPEDCTVVHGLCRMVAGFGIVYLVAKVAEVWWAGEAALLWTGSAALLWWAELAIGVVAPVTLWLILPLRRSSAVQWITPSLVLAGVLMNRFDATLYAQVVRTVGAVYTPHVLEWISTVGILAAALLAWIIGIRFFSGDEAEHSTH